MPDWLSWLKGRTPAQVALPATEPEGYAGFKVMLDEPSPAPALGFDGFAEALAELIMSSRAEFAAGIFGSWGSGKTTLMRAVQGRLAGDDVVTVWFNAWRYEKEPHLIIPLLDVLRDALRAKDRAWARDAAVAVGRAGRALAAGLKLSVDAIPGFRIDVEPGKMLESLSKSRRPLSLYHAGYAKLQEAISRISGGSGRRVVIFVDDLDRCLPETALSLLESMKVLFAVPGCVFVAALDQEVVQTAITIKYGADSEISAADYIKKIFQVPFTLPQDSVSDMTGYLDAVEASAGFSAAQRADFRDHVRPHLAQLAAAGPVNPREVKLLINSYVLQLKVMWLKLGDELNPDIVLALLCMHFRVDWQPFYDQLIAEPQVIQPLLRDAVQPPAGEQPRAVWLPGVTKPVPPSLLDYLREAAWPLLDSPDLRPYLAVTKSTWSAEPWIPQARIMAFQLQQSANDLQADAGAPEALLREAQDLLDFIARRREPAGSLRGIRHDLEETAREIVAALSEPSPDTEDRHTRLTDLLDQLDTVLSDYQKAAAACA